MEVRKPKIKSMKYEDFTDNEYLEKMIENYLHKSQMLKCVFLLVDIRHEPSANDKTIIE